MNTDSLNLIWSAIDSVNSKDPEQVIIDQKSLGSCELYGLRMSECLDRFSPKAGLALKIAARAQHIERWHLARSDYPLDRIGYLRWRTDLAKHHAEKTAQILTDHHVSQELINEVQVLLRKQGLKTNADTQTLEDVACLVFLQFYLDDFATKHSEEKLISIIKKTWVKMSSSGHKAALEIPFKPSILAIINKALQA